MACLLDGTGRGVDPGSSSSSDALPDVRMLPLSSVRVGDRVHSAAVDFARAQNRIFGTLSGVPVVRDDMPYPELVVLSARRILESK